MSEKKIAIILIIFVGVVLLILFRKTIFKLVLTFVCLVTLLICVNVLAPDKVRDVSKYIRNASDITKLAEESSNIRIKKTKGNKLKPEDIDIRIEDKWVNVGDIKDIKTLTNKNMEVEIQGKKYTVDDKMIKEMFKYIKS